MVNRSCRNDALYLWCLTNTQNHLLTPFFHSSLQTQIRRPKNAGNCTSPPTPLPYDVVCTTSYGAADGYTGSKTAYACVGFTGVCGGSPLTISGKSSKAACATACATSYPTTAVAVVWTTFSSLVQTCDCYTSLTTLDNLFAAPGFFELVVFNAAFSDYSNTQLCD